MTARATNTPLRSGPPAIYAVHPAGALDQFTTLDLIAELRRRLPAEHREIISDPVRAQQYIADLLQATTAHLEYEIFGVVFLDTRHAVIEARELFRGTIDSASVYPREIVKEALQSNAAAVILYHNHPSGNPEPSTADRQLTTRIGDALRLLEIRVLDHLVIGRDGVVSFAARGLV